MTILYDNSCAMGISKDPFPYSQTKHIDICDHFIRDLVENKVISLFIRINPYRKSIDWFVHKTFRFLRFKTLRKYLYIYPLD